MRSGETPSFVCPKKKRMVIRPEGPNTSHCPATLQSVTTDPNSTSSLVLLRDTDIVDYRIYTNRENTVDYISTI